MSIAIKRSPRGVYVRRAEASDVPAITACVHEAYLPYVERIGRQPGPMHQDYAEVVATCEVYVALVSEQVAGALVLRVDGDRLWVDNVAVASRFRGTGIGRVLLIHAERHGQQLRYDALHLFTHELMSENRAMYGRNGWREENRRVVDGYPRIFMTKVLRR